MVFESGLRATSVNSHSPWYSVVWDPFCHECRSKCRSCPNGLHAWHLVVGHSAGGHVHAHQNRRDSCEVCDVGVQDLVIRHYEPESLNCDDSYPRCGFTLHFCQAYWASIDVVSDECYETWPICDALHISVDGCNAGDLGCGASASLVCHRRSSHKYSCMY